MNQKQRIFVENYFSCESISETCRISRVSYPTALRWLDGGEVAEEIEARQNEIAKKNSQAVEKIFYVSQKKIAEIIQSPEATTAEKLRACEIVFNCVFKIREFSVVEKLEKFSTKNFFGGWKK